MTDKEFYDECHRLFSYDAETGLLTRKVSILGFWGNPQRAPKCKVGDVVGSLNQGYLRVTIERKRYHVHRIIWLMQTGKWPKAHIDHINGNRAENRWCNLREATNAENQFNRGKNSNNTSGFKGVFSSGRRKNPYKALIMLNSKLIHLGAFATPELAHEAYCSKAKELHGEFARLEQ